MSDGTPFDTDFSEIGESNLHSETTLRGVLNSTYSKAYYGTTYYVIKKGDYDEEKSYTGGDFEKQKTRYLRTAIGSNKISYIITNEWSEEYAYSMAQNGIYIPVIDRDSEQVVFTIEQYEAIREKMKGLTFYRADNFEIDKNARNEAILQTAEQMKKEAEGQISTEEKREKIVKLVKENMPKTVADEMIGDISRKTLEFIDTGSTGRRTNVPGNGDFDFILKCSSREEQKEMISKMRTFIHGTPTGGDNEFNIRYEDVKIEGLETPVDIDVTSETKKLEVEYSSDLCVRDRLDNIRNTYGEEAVEQVVDNILVAKKKLKEIGAYKKSTSKGSTELGGFGGIGVENWVLQNGGSFILAMETFLDATKGENGEDIRFEEVKKKYPIYDFGQNHRVEIKNDGHDHFIEGLTGAGFTKMKEKFPEILREYGIEYEYKREGHQVEKIEEFTRIDEKEEEQSKLFESFEEFEPSAEDYTITDYSRVYAMMAKYKVRNQEREYGMQDVKIGI